MLRFSTPLASTAVPFVRLLTYHAWPLRTCAELQACVIPPRHIWQGNDAAAAAATAVSSRTRTFCDTIHVEVGAADDLSPGCAYRKNNHTRIYIRATQP